MKLYIANCTRGHWNLNINRPEGGVIRLEIPSGQQRQFPMDPNKEGLEIVVEQIRKFGGQPRSNARGKLNEFTGIVYSTDKPLTEAEIVGANEDQLDHAQNRSVAQATRSAQAADLTVREGNNPKGKRRAKSTQISVSKKDGERGGEVPMMDIEFTESGDRKAKLPV